MNVSSFAELERAIKRAAKEGMKRVGKETKAKVKERIDSDVYGVYTPSEYTRTFELKESVDVKEYGELGIEIYHDTGKISPYSPNQHMSVINGRSSASSIPEIVHDGLSGSVFGTSGAYMSSRPYMDNARAEIKSTQMAEKILKDVFRSKGFRVE